ncbi:hypothetical protein GGQ84_001386 [Desulfitispora alkaliphila]|uniref:hypothetical protein n=1 Tax=Desulfitispora alkaliphila TaxID=622674 RepID=UPI003D1B148F
MNDINLTLAEELEKLAAGYRALAKSQKDAKEINIQDVSYILAEKMNKGKMADIKTLLKKYSAGKLVEVKPRDYPAIFEEAKKL